MFGLDIPGPRKKSANQEGGMVNQTCGGGHYLLLIPGGGGSMEFMERNKWGSSGSN